MAATGIAQSAGKPLVAVNHLEGHALVPRLCATMADGTNENIKIEFPYLLMLASGGHCQILLVHNVGQYELIGQTLDDSAGEAFDKVSKMLGLGYPGGPIVDMRATQGNPKRFQFPRPLCDKPGCDFSFSGIKTAARTFLDRAELPLSDEYINDFCASFQASVVDCIVNRLNNAMHDKRVQKAQPKTLVVAGGVAKNSAIRSAMEKLAKENSMIFAAPPMNLCTDNGAMIAWAGLENYAVGNIVTEPVAPRPRWPLTELKNE
jgi:N6-L-threonylcarbamoyladenine synthase